MPNTNTETAATKTDCATAGREHALAADGTILGMRCLGCGRVFAKGISAHRRAAARLAAKGA